MDITLNVYYLGTEKDSIHNFNVFGGIGFGLYHTGVAINGVEYAYGGDMNSEATGVFESIPKKAANYTYYQSYTLGTARDIIEVNRILHQIKSEFKANEYSLIHKNCNHFAEELCMRILGKGLPVYINRPARLGTLFSFILPDNLKKLNSSVPASQSKSSAAPAR